MAEEEIVAYFEEAIFDGLFAAVGIEERRNEQQTALSAALAAGTVWYLEGRFYGAFNAAISRELRALGAVKGLASFSLPREQLPFGLRGKIEESRQKSEVTHHRVLETLIIAASLASLQEVPTGIRFEKTVDKMTADLQKQFTRTVSSVAEVPAIPPVLKEEMLQQITQGTDFAVKNFSVESTTELRKKVLQNLQEGGRADRLVAIIETEFGVAKRKARFIAENETSLATSKFREERYKSVGADSYIWSTSGDGKVRPTHGESNNHRVLEGRTFAWSSPPIVDAATGRRRHPGQDYNCRCVALPVINT